MIITEISLYLHPYLALFMKYTSKNLLTTLVLALIVVTSCTNHQRLAGSDDNGYNRADSIVNAIGDTRDLPRLIEVTDSLENIGELSPVRAIFYKTIAYNLMGQSRTALSLYYQLAAIDVKKLKTQADIECFLYSYKDYVRLLCNMRRYDRALREAYNADQKLKEAGYNTFLDHHDIAQMIGECQLYLEQYGEAAKNFEKSLKGIHARLATNSHPLDLRECQKTMNAIAMVLIHRGRYDEAAPWIERQDSLFAIADKHPHRDSIFVDEMKAEINYSKALLAHAQGKSDEAERAFAEYQSTQMAKQLGNIIHSNEYLMLTGRYDEAARNYEQLDRFLKENGFKADLENFGLFLIPKYRANLLAGRLDSALRVASLVAEYYDTALVRQKMSDADLLATIYDTEGKERQIAQQRAELSQERLWTVVIGTIIFAIFVAIYIIQHRRAYKKLDATNHELMLANERAEESARMKTKFIQQISHEVRTPLNILSGYSQVLGDLDIEIDYDDLQEICQKILHNSDRITLLVDKMLDLSLISSDSEIECRDETTPADVAERAINLSRIRKFAHLEFQIYLSSEAKSLQFVTNKMSAVKALTMLLDNAIKFTNPSAFKNRQAAPLQAHVTMSVSVVGKKVLFVVEDTGIGIPAEEAENIFNEFVQLDEYTDGTGIGLPIARSLARHMQGDVVLDTSYTNGARFVMTLPLLRPETTLQE